MTADDTREMLAGLMEAFADSVKSVRFADKECNGLIGVDVQNTAPGVLGEMGMTTNAITVDTSELDSPGRGATVIVGGKKVFCVTVRTDPTGGVMRIEYSEQKPFDP